MSGKEVRTLTETRPRLVLIDIPVKIQKLHRLVCGEVSSAFGGERRCRRFAEGRRKVKLNFSVWREDCRMKLTVQRSSYELGKVDRL